MLLEASCSDAQIDVALLTCLLLTALFVAVRYWGSFLWEGHSSVIRPTLFPKDTNYKQEFSAYQICIRATNHILRQLLMFVLFALGMLQILKFEWLSLETWIVIFYISTACLHSDPLPIRKELMTHMLFNQTSPFWKETVILLKTMLNWNPNSLWTIFLRGLGKVGSCYSYKFQFIAHWFLNSQTNL